MTAYQPKNQVSDPAGMLKLGREKLFASAMQWDAKAFIHAHAELFDAYFRHCFAASRVGPQLALNRNPYAVIALGGYGRGEQCVFSDVDLLLLFDKAVPDEAEQLVQEAEAYREQVVANSTGDAERFLSVLSSYELAPAVTVCGVAPGAILPPTGGNSAATHRHFVDAAPLKRQVTPGEVAEAVVFCLRSDAVTGQIIYADGGQHLMGT